MAVSEQSRPVDRVNVHARTYARSFRTSTTIPSKMQGQTTPPDTCWQASCVNGRTEALSGTSAEVRDLPDRLEVSRRLNGAHSSIGRLGSRALRFPFASVHANLTSLQSEVTCERCTHDVARGRLRKVERLTIVVHSQTAGTQSLHASLRYARRLSKRW